jgi:hypothetical protein
MNAVANDEMHSYSFSGLKFWESTKMNSFSVLKLNDEMQ